MKALEFESWGFVTSKPQSLIRRLAGDHHVVPMNHLVVGAMPEGFGDFVGPKAADTQHVVGRVVGQPPSKLAALAIAKRDDIPFVEPADGFEDSDGQKASPLALHGTACSGVQDQLSTRLGGVADPSLTGRDGVSLGENQRTNRFGR